MVARTSYTWARTPAATAPPVIYTLIGTAKLGGIDPQHYLRHVLERIAYHPINRIDELLPWAVADQIAPAAQEDQDLPLAA